MKKPITITVENEAEASALMRGLDRLFESESLSSNPADVADEADCPDVLLFFRVREEIANAFPRADPYSKHHSADESITSTY